MNPKSPKFSAQQTAETSSPPLAQPQSGERQFERVEQLLRHDQASVTPPPTILQRLKESLTKEIPPPRQWWKRWFSR